MYYQFFLCAGDTCHWLWWTICHSVICAECLCWCTHLTVYRRTYKTVFRFHLHISHDPSVHLLVLQWRIPINIFVVVSECRLWHGHVCVQWIPLSTNRIEGDSRRLYTARYKGRFMKSLKNAPWWYDSDKRCVRSNSTANSKIISEWHNQSHGAFRDPKWIEIETW